MSAGMCEHIRVYTNRDAYLFERACRERDIELLSRTWSQTDDVPIARGNSDRRVSILSTRFVRSSFPSGIRRSRSRIQKTRGRTEKKKKKREKENKNVEHREKKRMDSGGFALQNPSVKYPRLFRSVYPQDTILSRGKRSDGNRWISFHQERIVCEAIVSRTRVGIRSSAQDRCCRGLEIKWDVD